MKLFVALFALIALLSAVHASKHVPILKYDSKLDSKHGTYNYNYEAGNGIGVAEHGHVKNLGQKGHEENVAEGHFAYSDPKGHKFVVHYTADENGFRAKGDHLPTPPPIPKEILESLGGGHHKSHGKW